MAESPLDGCTTTRILCRAGGANVQVVAVIFDKNGAREDYSYLNANKLAHGRFIGIMPGLG
jgi:hypothetical protein